MAVETAKFSGSAGYSIRSDIELDGSVVKVGAITAHRASGYSGQFTSSKYSWSVAVTGGDGSKGTWGPYDFRGGVSSEPVTGAKTYTRSGTVTVTIKVSAAFGTATITKKLTIQGRPPKPTNIALDRATFETLRYRFNLNNPLFDSVPEEDYVQVRYSRNADMSGSTYVKLPKTATSYTLNKLVPNDRYYAQVRSHNRFGYGTFSDVATARTLTINPPKMVAEAAASGRAIIVKLSPPIDTGGGEFDYEVEFAYTDGVTRVVQAVVRTSGSFTYRLVRPGLKYEVRARVRYRSSGTTSPWTATTFLTLPRPNTDPGDYYDGDMSPSGLNTFGWAGTAHASQSIVYAPGVLGWHAIGDPGYDGTFALHKVVGGIQGAYASRIIFRAAPTAPGIHVGMDPTVPEGRSLVGELTQYGAALFVETSRAQLMQAEIVWLDEAFTEISITTSAPQVVPADEPTRLVMIATSPSGAMYASARWRDLAADDDGENVWSPWQSGDSVFTDAAMVMLGEVTDYFDGDTEDTIFFRYAWQAAANASISSRTTLSVLEFDPLQDPDCEVIPAPPMPPYIPSECIEDVGTWRRLVYQILDGDVKRWTTTIPTITLITSEEAMRQVRIRLYPNYSGVAPSEVDTSEWESEMILSYLPGNTTLTLDGISRRAYASVDGGESRSANKLLFGTNGVPATWPELECGVGYLMTVDVPIDNSVDNLEVNLTLTQRS